MIQIVCAIDNNYIQHCGVMLCSLFSNNLNVKFHIHIISNELNREDFQKLVDFIKKYNQEISHYIVDENAIKNAPLSHHISLSTYYRVLIPQLIPKNIDKVLYIDCDVLVRKSLEPLWEINIEDYHIGASKEFISKEHKMQLGIPVHIPYFNAGVLLINVRKWRETNTSEILINFIYQNVKKIIFWDQDALNAVLHNSCYIFSSNWNVTGGFFEKKNAEFGFTNEEYDSCFNNPFIIHFTGSDKPWNFEVRHVYKKEYGYYLKKTPWKNIKPEGYISVFDRLKKKIIYIRNRIFYKFNVLKHFI